MRVLLSVWVCGFAMWLPPPTPAQSGGLAPEWEVRNQLTALAQHVQRFKPIVDQVKPQEWVSQGAPAAYVDQGKRVQAEIGYLLTSVQVLADQPQKLTAALDTYFRMQSLDLLLRSYEAGIRKYQNPALADLLQGVMGQTAADRQKLRQYVLDLATDREVAFKVADEEAQRCRAVLSRQPHAGGSKATAGPKKGDRP